MTAVWSAGGDPLHIYTVQCGLREKVAANLLDRWDLVYVDIRRRVGVVELDADGYLPHLQYTPQYVQTEEDRGPWVITGNTPDKPVFRFDPGPFFCNVAGKIVLTGGAGTATYLVRVYLKRFSKAFPLRHTLTIGTTGGRFSRPLGASGLWLPSSTNATEAHLGGFNRSIHAPNGGFVACGAFQEYVFTPDEIATFEVIPPW